jgi:hypothetical protein
VTTEIDAVEVEALFVSYLQRSQHPTADEVREAVTATIGSLGVQGCAAFVAQEFGDHPDTATERMCWCRAAVEAAFTSV